MNTSSDATTPLSSTAPSPTTVASRTTRVTEVVLPGVVEPSGLQVRVRDLPAPVRGEVLVRVEASGVSFAERSMRRGRYPGQPPFPFVPGYDLVGTVTAVGPDVDVALTGTRVAVMTKTGGWASHALLPAADLVPIRADLDPAEVETVVVNGVTAWQMLHRTARVRRGQTVLVHGASGGVGTVLVQLAVHAGIRVIATASPRHHEALRTLGAEPLDYDTPDLEAAVRRLVPDGVDAAFDHLGGESLTRSWRLLAPQGTLVSYAIASKIDAPGSLWVPFLAALARVLVWQLLPNGKHASFYDLWSGHRRRPTAFRARTRQDLTAVLDLLASGVLTAQIGARLPLTSAAEAMELAESHTVRGKIVLIP
jgi:NADPH:quinone reductase-like Zn-dependent oxidoreductase